MAARIAFVLCEHYQKEAKAVIEAEKLQNVVVAAFPARCGCPPLGAAELALLDESLADVEQIEVFGASCLKGFAALAAARKIHFHRFHHCLEMIADSLLINACLQKGAYLTTPGWLSHWPDNMRRMGLCQETAREMFVETTSRIVLLDTGVEEQSMAHLQAFSAYIDQPYEVQVTGLSVMRLLFVRSVLTSQIKHE